MITKTLKLTYEAPETSVDWIKVEQDFLTTGKPGQLQDMDWNDLGDDDDFDIDY